MIIIRLSVVQKKILMLKKLCINYRKKKFLQNRFSFTLTESPVLLVTGHAQVD